MLIISTPQQNWKAMKKKFLKHGKLIKKKN